jgi:hypothetical protein
MANGQEKLAKNWKNIVANIFRDNPDWSAPQIRRQLIIILGEARTPGLSAIQKELSPMRERYQRIQATGLETPWHLNAHPLPAEAIPHILRVQKYIVRNFHQERDRLSIRQAIWISRLYAIKHFTDRDLWKLSLGYTLYELSCELADVPIDTTWLDKGLLNGKWEQTLSNWAKEGGLELKDAFLKLRGYKTSKERENDERTHSKESEE